MNDPTISSAPAKNPLDRFFRLSERATSLPQELIAGATTFAAMAYIIAVNPAIMSNAGMDRGDLVIATALAAIFGTVMMGLWANLPLAVAPAMGSNIIFTYVIVKQMGAPWQGALAMVALTGIVFLALSLSKVRERVAKDVPEALKVGIQAAVGALILFIALRGAGFIVANPSTYIALGSLKNPATILTMAGILLTPILVVRRVPGALIIAIAAITIVGLFVPGSQRGLWATKTFCCRNRPYGRFGQQNVLVAKGHRGGRGSSRLAKQSGATGEAGSALTRARLDGGAVFGICVLARARFLKSR